MAAVCRPRNRWAFQRQVSPLGRRCDNCAYVFALLQRRSTDPEGKKERRRRRTARHRGVHGRDFVSNDSRLFNRLSVVPMEDRFRIRHLDGFVADLIRGYREL
jgi:hypothetical protein